jgi:hypothetical protein
MEVIEVVGQTMVKVIPVTIALALVPRSAGNWPTHSVTSPAGV